MKLGPEYMYQTVLYNNKHEFKKINQIFISSEEKFMYGREVTVVHLGGFEFCFKY